MTEISSPDPRSRRRLYIILTAIAVVVIALIAGSFLYGSSVAGGKASDYDHDYASWRTKQKPILLSATATVPKGTYLKSDANTVKALATQTKGCDTVAAERKKLVTAAGRLPTMGTSGLLGKLNSDYSDARERSDRRAKIVHAYVKSASAKLAQIERDCRWNIGVNKSAVEPDKLWSSSKKYAMKPGDTEPGGIFCAKGKDGCVSSIAKKKNKYADLRIKAAKLYRAAGVKFYNSKECRATSYGSACDVLFKTSDAYQKLQLKNYQYVRTMKSSVNNANLPKHNKALDKLYAADLPKVKKAVLALDPALKKDKTVRAYPKWSDHFFARMAKLLLADLKDQRAALEKL
ncbi:MAG: hypothetical protein QOJ72_93 [Nocardioidaceae bacterium]|nr:hypothetical protein [Nocardioidaceae bacterium]